MGSINTCRFHGNAFDFAFCEPLGDRIQITVSPKAPYVLFGAVWRHADPMLTCANVDALLHSGDVSQNFRYFCFCYTLVVVMVHSECLLYLGFI